MIVNRSSQDISEQNIILKLNGKKLILASKLENEILISHTPQEEFTPNTAYNIELYYHMTTITIFVKFSILY